MKIHAIQTGTVAVKERQRVALSKSPVLRDCQGRGGIQAAAKQHHRLLVVHRSHAYLYATRTLAYFSAPETAQAPSHRLP